MDQQKILYGVFTLVIVLAVVCVLALAFIPSTPVVVEEDSPQTPDQARTETYDPSTWVQNGDTVPDFKPLEPDDGVIVIGVEEPDAVKDAEQKPEAAALVTKENNESAPLLSVPSARDIKTPPAPPKQTASRPTASAAASAAPRQTAPVKRAVRAVEYWIQAGSFTSRSRAEESQSELKKNGFVCLITSKTVDGINYYRLRLGPYENKNEAEKFLGWIRGLERFGQSYISEVYVQKTL
ncbi:MAG: SPOR domain-containing protein [Spirochaetales bacterium]|nr:SPOR domain-containing protein [Spirochaetales bacterium]